MYGYTPNSELHSVAESVAGLRGLASIFFITLKMLIPLEGAQNLEIIILDSLKASLFLVRFCQWVGHIIHLPKILSEVNNLKVLQWCLFNVFIYV